MKDVGREEQKKKRDALQTTKIKKCPHYHACPRLTQSFFLSLFLTSDMDNTSRSKADPYAALAQSVKRLSEPMNQLLNTHDQFTLQNVRILNNVSTIPRFNESLKKGFEVQATQEKLDNSSS